MTAERAFLARLEGGCVVPVAALGRVEGEILHLEALISDLEGRRVLREQKSAPVAEAAELGHPNGRKSCWPKEAGKSSPHCTAGPFNFKN